MTYKASDGIHSYLKNFGSLINAQSYFSSIGLGAEYEITQASADEQIPEKSNAEKLAERKVFGVSLVDKYLLDNDAIAAARGEPLTIAESNQQSAKFQAVLGILPWGSLRQALAIIQGITTDTIFTQERKDYFIAELTIFIESQQ